jgi:hypothetical protein
MEHRLRRRSSVAGDDGVAVEVDYEVFVFHWRTFNQIGCKDQPITIEFLLVSGGGPSTRPNETK